MDQYNSLNNVTTWHIKRFRRRQGDDSKNHQNSFFHYYSFLLSMTCLSSCVFPPWNNVSIFFPFFHSCPHLSLTLNQISSFKAQFWGDGEDILRTPICPYLPSSWQGMKIWERFGKGVFGMEFVPKSFFLPSF